MVEEKVKFKRLYEKINIWEGRLNFLIEPDLK